MFTPSGTKNGPNISDLEGSRVTDVRFCDGSGSETLHDQWITNKGCNRSLTKRWTGCTIFQIRSIDRKPVQVHVSSAVVPTAQVTETLESVVDSPDLLRLMTTLCGEDKENVATANHTSGGGILDQYFPRPAAARTQQP